MKVLYVAGPYRADGEWSVVLNIREAEAVALELWKMGFAAICPHKNTALFGGAVNDDVWLRGDLEILRRCDGVVLLPDWRKSVGAQAEYDTAIRTGKEIYFWPQDISVLETMEDS